jgi:restriction endonuclease S subunit
MACSKKQNGYIGVVNETAQPALSLYNLNHFKLPVAPLEEQEAIASYLDSETSKIDTRIAKRRKQIELLQEYKQALITAAVTGKIDVREYNS